MADYPSNYGQGHQRAGTRGVVNANLDVLETGADTAIDGAKQIVHEFRARAQEIADAMLDRVNQSWEEQRPRMEAYMNAHPWLVLGGLVLLAYLLSENQRTGQSPDYRYQGRRSFRPLPQPD
jgi:hypothetical protein